MLYSYYKILQFFSGGEKQAIVIEKANYFDAKLLILDKPPAALFVTET